ncbi:hypothetical protein [Citrobacter phage CVT22]|uniref:Uncharacterized protein n=1 Tax=Citrobacter phage CVT22 TaxID=1622234 RepID=A0A0R6C6X7_9CAUD|nr:hypothetical protein APL39_gp75 [Citrobacter phage CVT22]AJT60778.1 hypothetical protein [Citrobacter phage CVT22]
MSTVQIKLKNDKGLVITALKEGNCVSIHNDTLGEFLSDVVHASELTAQAHFNFWLLHLGDKGFKRE